MKERRMTRKPILQQLADVVLTHPCVQQVLHGEVSPYPLQQGGEDVAANEMARREGQRKGPVQGQRLGAAHILLILFSGNFLGILCARTLHFQFYSW